MDLFTLYKSVDKLIRGLWVTHQLTKHINQIGFVDYINKPTGQLVQPFLNVLFNIANLYWEWQVKKVGVKDNIVGANFGNVMLQYP